VHPTDRRQLILGLATALAVLAAASSTAQAKATPPSVSVTAPARHAKVSGAITLAARVGHAEGVVRVKWFVDGLEVATDRNRARWSRVWDSARITPGVHELFAKARGATGGWGTSRSISFSTTNARALVDAVPPTVSVAAPNDGDEVSGAAVRLAAKAFDNVGVSRVKWYVDGAEVAYDHDGAPWSQSWDSGSVVNGGHRLLTKARDTHGNWSASASTAFDVHNEPCGHGGGPPATWDHVVWIVFENTDYEQIVGSPNAPYLNGLSAACGLATNYHGLAHPSLPNYIAMTSGSTQGISDDGSPAFHLLTGPSIFSQLGPTGWRALQESMPSDCATTGSSLYAPRHNPPIYYTDLAADCASRDVPLGTVPDLSARFTFVTPNLCHDMHSSPCASTPDAEIALGDAWLAEFLPTVFASPEYRSGTTAVFITWDEDDYSNHQHIPTFVAAPSVRRGTAVATRLDHYSLLRTTEDMLGIGEYLGAAAEATGMRRRFGL
jgi:hypothetical protein